MKKQVKTWMAATVFIFFSACVVSQKESSVSRRISDRGYWVEESNIHHPKNHIFRFYTNEHVLVYTEKLEGIKLNIEKRKVQEKLKEVLDTVLTAWQKNKQPEADKEYVAVKLK